MGDRRIVTVLFTDVSGFTAMSEKLDPEAVTEIINNFFKVLVEPIYRFGGVVDKYIGDAIMALFGAPIAHEDDAERAVRAAWEMQIRAKEHAERLEKQTGILLKVRIGLNTGLVVAGQVGSSQRSDYTVMGDTVNLAQRMESNARVGKVLVTAETYHQTQHAFKFEALEPIMVKGKAEPIEVYEVAGPLPRTTFLNTGSAEDAFVGREAEQQALDSAWNFAMQGRPHVIALSGEAGVGKTALALRFLKKVRAEGAVVHSSRCWSYEHQTAYAMVAELLRSWIGVSEHDPSSRALSSLRAFLATSDHGDERTVALLARLLSIEVDNPDVASLSPRQVRTGAFIALDDLVVRQARKGPLVLCLEDMHWADEASLEWLSGLIERVSTESGQLPLAILAQTRSELAALKESASRLPTTQLAIGPLQPSDVEALATIHLGATIESLPEPVQRVVRHVLERADGNPFYLSEVLRASTEGGVLIRDGASWKVGNTAEGALPTSVRGAVAARLDRLTTKARHLLQVAAVIGKQVDPGLLDAVVPKDEALDELVTQKLLFVRKSGEIGFSQTLICEVAYETLLISARRELHRKVGKALEVQVGDDVGNHAAVLAEHFVKGESAPKAARYLYLAAEQAKASSAIAEALVFYSKSLTWQAAAEASSSDRQDSVENEMTVPKAEILLQMARLETLRGELDSALSHLDEHEALAGRSTRSLRARGDVLEQKGDFAGALATYREAREAAQGYPLEAARAWASEGNVLRRMGDFEAAIELCQRANEILEAEYQPAEAAFVHGVMGICYHRVNDFEGALREHAAALRLRQQAQDLDGVAKSHNNLGILASELGRWAEAYQQYSKALLMFRKLGDRPHLSMALNNLGDLLLKQGDDAMAERHFKEAYKLANQLGDRVNIITALGNLGEVMLTRGSAEEALAHFDACLVQAAESGHNEYGRDLQLGRARALAMMGEAEKARKALDLAQGEAEAAGNATFLGMVDRVRAEIALGEGQQAEALELARRSFEALRDSGMQLESARTLLILAQVAPKEEARQVLLEAIERLTAMGARRELAVARSLLEQHGAAGRSSPEAAPAG